MLRDMAQTTTQEAIRGNLRALKGRRRVSDAKLAEVTGVSRSAFNDRMNGKAKFQIEELQAIANLLDVSLEQLLSDEAVA